MIPGGGSSFRGGMRVRFGFWGLFFWKCDVQAFNVSDWVLLGSPRRVRGILPSSHTRQQVHHTSMVTHTI